MTLRDGKSSAQIERRRVLGNHKAVLKRLPAGGSQIFLLPVAAYDRREIYRGLNGIAHSLFGSGAYTLRVVGSCVWVKRLSPESWEFKERQRLLLAWRARAIRADASL